MFNIFESLRDRRTTEVLQHILETLNEINAKLDRDGAPSGSGGDAPSRPQKDERKAQDRKAVLAQLNNHFKSKGYDAERIASDTGLTPGNVRDILSGAQNIGRKSALKLASVYGLDPQYLLSGNGRLKADKRPKENAKAPAREAGKPSAARSDAALERYYVQKYAN